MNPETRPSGARPVRSRLYLLLIMAMFAAPVVLAWLVFYVFPDWRPTATVNNGTLVRPVRLLPDFQARNVDGKPIDQTVFQGKWSLVTLEQGACGEACVRRLYDVRQIRLAQGKNIDRLQRVMLWVPADADAAAGAELERQFPGETILTLDAGAAAGLIAAFAVETSDPLAAGRLYLVDPLGNLMMLYPADADPRGAIKDLERLLMYSGLG